jgi:hypothetical protein
VIVAFSLQLIDYCDALFIFIIAFKLLSLLIKFVANSQFYPLFWKNSDFDNFLSLTTSLDKFSSTSFTTGIIHERKRKIVETLLSVHAFYDIEKILDLGRRTQKLCTNCILDLCEYDVHGIKLLSVNPTFFI